MDQALIRFITAGSVDDGKSTLIGRLLYDSKTLMDDYLQRISVDELNFASLTDGLEAEIEQGITIDVAYRYFATPQRKYIIADTPGHEQYTRNMVTGASTADAAIILIDASRLDFSHENIDLLTQTKRHSAILKLLQCQHIIIAVNKLDLVAYSQDKYLAIVAAYQLLADKLGIKQFQSIPISALYGDNIVDKSDKMPWYEGATLLEWLDNLTVQTEDKSEKPLILPVQSVIRQDGRTADDFRGYQGRIEQGSIMIGQQISVQPRGIDSKIKNIYSTYEDSAIDQADAGENITVTLENDIDVSRGDVIVAEQTGLTSKHIYATICWFDETPLNISRKYRLKQGPTEVSCKISSIDYRLDVNQLLSSETLDHQLKMNDIAKVKLKLQQAIVVSYYNNNRQRGAFILIDEITNQTVAAGMISASDRPNYAGWSI